MVGNPYPSRKKMRLNGFDYKTQMCYFITVVTFNRVCLFGHIENEETILNEAGKMIGRLYQSIEGRFPQISCMDYVVMPNHFHSILYLDKENDNSIPMVMDYFKSITTDEYIKGVKERGWERFDGRLWQRNYWDDIIWNERQLAYIQNYIALNPSRWNKDNINPNHDKDVDHILNQFRQLR